MMSPSLATARDVLKQSIARAVRLLAPARRDLPLALWDLSRDHAGRLARSGVDLSSLLERFGSPLHVVDAARLASNAARFRAGGAEVYYSYKTNPVPGALRLLYANGLGAEVVSEYELWLALRLGVEPRRIVYNGPAKSDQSIALAVDRGVGLLNVNARAELARVAAIARARNKRATVGVRVVPPGCVGGQFGERIDTGAALSAFREALSHPELHVVAVHAHYNGRIATRERLDEYLSSLFAFADELRARLGLDLEILDLGGNLSCPTTRRLSARDKRLAVTFGCEPSAPSMSATLSIDDYVARVAARVKGHFGVRAPRLFLEPGRTMTGDAQVLLCRVASLGGQVGAGLRWAVLDAGVNVAEAVRGEHHQLFPLAPRAGARPRLYRLVGPSCTLDDQLYPAWTLPELAVGDGLAIMDSGAYFVPYSTRFSFPRPAVAAIAGGQVTLLSAAETFEDLVAKDVSGPRAARRIQEAS